MKILPRLAMLLALYQTNGCDESQPTKIREEHPNPIGRFVAVETHGSSDVALDSMTGQLCRTWQWEYRGANNPNKGGLDDLPTCFNIYRQYPYTVTPAEIQPKPSNSSN